MEALMVEWQGIELVSELRGMVSDAEKRPRICLLIWNTYCCKPPVEEQKIGVNSRLTTDDSIREVRRCGEVAMRKLVMSIVGVAILGLSSAANATVSLLDCSMSCTGPNTTDDTTTIGYSESPLDNPTFTEWLTFSNDLDGLYSVSLSTSSASVDFTSAVLSDGITNYALHFVVASGPNEFWGLDTTFIPMGTYTLLIQGNNSSTGVLGGTVTINPAAVPEPATWAMMVIGFGLIGWQLRRRRAAFIHQYQNLGALSESR